MLRNHMIEVAAASPDLLIANPSHNARQIIAQLKANRGTGIVVFPELCICGYTCADLFLNDTLLQASEDALVAVAAATKELPGLLAAVGLPVRFGNALYNCAAFVGEGRILCLVPKINIPTYGEFYEGRWFASGRGVLRESVRIGGQEVPFGTRFLLEDPDSGAVVACEICEDLWVPDKPSSHASIAGANIIVNLSASDEIIGKQDFRRQMVIMQSAACYCGYIYASAGAWESSTDLVYSGHSLIAENGHLLAESIYPGRNTALRAILDLDTVASNRVKMTTFRSGSSPAGGGSACEAGPSSLTGSECSGASHGDAAGPSRTKTCAGYTLIPAHIAPVSGRYDLSAAGLASALKARSYPVPARPFVPAEDSERRARCETILRIQANGLATRVRGSGIHRLVIGISGGLDSTLALLAAHTAREMEPDIHIIAYTLPNRGNTTSRTYNNACALMRLLADEQRTIYIDESVALHLRDIGHRGEYQGEGDITYENAQARMRTYILMDAANMENALVVGTGDLSELALGWCTYNGDHMSMYAVNASVPKTLVQYIVRTYADTCAEAELREVLYSVCDTPITPELTPSCGDEIAQKTEEKIGRYDLNDFFLFYTLRYGMDCRKIYALALVAYDGMDPEALREAGLQFFTRFFRQQFKRSCLPDGPKVGSVALSPRGDWRMPSDADPALWLAELREETSPEC